MAKCSGCSQTSIFTDDSNCLEFDGDGTEDDELTADLIFSPETEDCLNCGEGGIRLVIDPNVDNALSCGVDGLFVEGGGPNAFLSGSLSGSDDYGAGSFTRMASQTTSSIFDEINYLPMVIHLAAIDLVVGPVPLDAGEAFTLTRFIDNRDDEVWTGSWEIYISNAACTERMIATAFDSAPEGDSFSPPAVDWTSTNTGSDLSIVDVNGSGTFVTTAGGIYWASLHLNISRST